MEFELCDIPEAALNEVKPLLDKIWEIDNDIVNLTVDDLKVRKLTADRVNKILASFSK